MVRLSGRLALKPGRSRPDFRHGDGDDTRPTVPCFAIRAHERSSRPRHARRSGPEIGETEGDRIERADAHRLVVLRARGQERCSRVRGLPARMSNRGPSADRPLQAAGPGGLEARAPGTSGFLTPDRFMRRGPPRPWAFGGREGPHHRTCGSVHGGSTEAGGRAASGTRTIGDVPRERGRPAIDNEGKPAPAWGKRGIALDPSSSQGRRRALPGSRPDLPYRAARKHPGATGGQARLRRHQCRLDPVPIPGRRYSIIGVAP